MGQQEGRREEGEDDSGQRPPRRDSAYEGFGSLKAVAARTGS